MEIAELLDANGIDFKKKSNHYLISCLNPQHEDNNPSMNISNNGLFFCFSCGYKGNIFKHFNVDKVFYSAQVTVIKDKIQEARSSRMLTIPLTATKFDREFRGLSAETYKCFNAFTDTSIDELKDFLIIPIKNINDEYYSFIGRRLFSNIAPKYIFYPHKTKVLPYPSRVKHVDGEIVLVEGIFDMMHMHENGFTNAVCIFGTHVSDSVIPLWKLQGVTSVALLLDGDDAGRKGAIRISNLLDKHNIVSRIIYLPEGKDPNDLNDRELHHAIYEDRSD
jgi:DNA primase